MLNNGPITRPVYGVATLKTRRNCSDLCTPTPNVNPLLPTFKGTHVHLIKLWLCGHRIYTALPVNWTGKYALADMTDGAMIIRLIYHKKEY